MQSSNEPCQGHKNFEIPFRVYDWDKLGALLKPEVSALYYGCTEGCRKFMIEQYKSLIKFAKIGIKYYKYQIIPETMAQGDHLSFPEFIGYCYHGNQPDDEFIETHLNHVMREGKFVPKEDSSDEGDEEGDEESGKEGDKESDKGGDEESDDAQINKEKD
ncbi:hypothetical protein ACTFIY_005841 [Dictyostelium cf. discoideum]